MSSSASGNTYAAGSVDRAIQIQLNSVLGSAAPTSKMQPFGVLSALQSPQNRSVLQFQIDTGDGSLNEGTGNSKKVFFKYQQPIAQSNIKRTAVSGCSSERTLKPCNDSAEITNSPIRTEKYFLPSKQIKREGKTFEQAMAEQIALNLNALRRDVNEVLAAELAGAAGQWIDGSPFKSFNITNAADGSLRFQGVSKMKTQLKNAGFVGAPFIIGGGNWDLFEDYHMVGGLQDIGIMTGDARVKRFTYVYDDMVSGVSILNDADGAFAMEPGAVQLLNWVANRGLGREIKDDHIRSTVFDPMSGILFDLFADYTFCPAGGNPEDGSGWTFWLQTYVQSWTMPTDAYQTGHDLENVNGLYKVIGAEV